MVSSSFLITETNKNNNNHHNNNPFEDLEEDDNCNMITTNHNHNNDCSSSDEQDDNITKTNDNDFTSLGQLLRFQSSQHFLTKLQKPLKMNGNVTSLLANPVSGMDAVIEIMLIF